MYSVKQISNHIATIYCTLQRQSINMRRGGHPGRLKKAKTGIYYVGHVDEGSTIALAQQLDNFKTSNDKG